METCIESINDRKKRKMMNSKLFLAPNHSRKKSLRWWIKLLEKFPLMPSLMSTLACKDSSCLSLMPRNPVHLQSFQPASSTQPWQRSQTKSKRKTAKNVNLEILSMLWVTNPMAVLWITCSKRKVFQSWQHGKYMETMTTRSRMWQWSQCSTKD